jgi:hypothetical protein
MDDRTDSVVWMVNQLTFPPSPAAQLIEGIVVVCAICGTYWRCCPGHGQQAQLQLTTIYEYGRHRATW